MSRQHTPRSIENLESRSLMAFDMLQLGVVAPDAPAQTGFDTESEYFIADSFSFGVEREMKESGEKGGTEDINIGVGELQECTISKSMDAASPNLAEVAHGANSLQGTQVDLVQAAETSDGPLSYLKYQLDRALVKPSSNNGNPGDCPTEQVALYYNNIQFAYRQTDDGIVGFIALFTEHNGNDDADQVNYSNDRNSFVADSFSFGVEREMKESGEKGGTEDINIGVGELQECTISKSMDAASPILAQFAINGNTLQNAEIEFIETADTGNGPVCYLKFTLDRAFVKSWSMSGDTHDRPREEVAFYYNKIEFSHESADDAATTLAEVLNSPAPRGSSDVDEFFAEDRVSFGVEREMKESGEKAGTQDINIGVGELQECTIS